MLGDDLRVWFEMFDGIIVYRPTPGGGHVADGWLSVKDIESRFASARPLFGGKPYDPCDLTQRNSLTNHIIEYAGAFVACGLMERRREIIPPTLDYRLTNFGRRVGNWGYGDRAGVRKRALFFALAVWFKVYRFRWLITAGALGWGVLNAFRFYAYAIAQVEALPFMAWSAVAVAVLAGIWALLKSKLGD